MRTSLIISLGFVPEESGIIPFRSIEFVGTSVLLSFPFGTGVKAGVKFFDTAVGGLTKGFSGLICLLGGGGG